jgi:hypothetical protein
VPPDESVPPDLARFVAREQRAGRLPTQLEPLPAGELGERLTVGREEASRLSIEAAKRAAGLYHPTKRTEVVWVDGDSELAVGVGGVRVETTLGAVVVTLPVRCDQTGPTEVHVTFAVGEPGRPTGLYAATQRRPRGPAAIVDTWGDAIVAFAWNIVLDLVSGLAGASGKDARGNKLVPVELEATPEGLAILPMARYRFTGSATVSRGPILRGGRE